MTASIQERLRSGQTVGREETASHIDALETRAKHDAETIRLLGDRVGQINEECAYLEAEEARLTDLTYWLAVWVLIMTPPQQETQPDAELSREPSAFEGSNIEENLLRRFAGLNKSGAVDEDARTVKVA